jgi:hypothetical protein
MSCENIMQIIHLIYETDNICFEFVQFIILRKDVKN